MKLVIASGFLGSGKTTAITRACQQLMSIHKKVAVITNDQGDQQVDSLFIKSFGIATKEVSNGCFCCHYDQLESHLLSLSETDYPDFVFAESVGSCTDLIATVVKPLHAIRPEIETMIISFADSNYLVSLIEGTASFMEEPVRYIYKKQLEEADILILNKTDLLTPSQIQTVTDVIRSEYPGKKILLQSSFIEDDIKKWIGVINDFNTDIHRESLDLDYKVYGDGESKLAWLDKSLNIHTEHTNAVFIGQKIIGSIFDLIQKNQITIGHLKFFMETDQWKEKISFTSTSTSSSVMLPGAESNSIKLLINARVQTEPEKLRELIDKVLSASENTYGCTIVNERWSVFKPGYPRPLHRIA